MDVVIAAAGTAAAVAGAAAAGVAAAGAAVSAAAAAALAVATETDKILNDLKMTKVLTLAFAAASSCLAEGF